MKNKLIFGISVLVAFVIGMFVGNSMTVSQLNKATANNTVNENKIESNNTKQPAKSEEQKAIKFGEEGTSGNWSIKVLDSQEATTIQAGNSSDNKTTSQKFIVIKLQMKNIAQNPEQYAPTEFMLGDMKTKTQYNTAFDAMQAANNKETIYNKNNGFISIYEDVNPNVPKQTYIIFEVPKDFNIKDGVLINKNKGSQEPTGFYLK